MFKVGKPCMQSKMQMSRSTVMAVIVEEPVIKCRQKSVVLEVIDDTIS